MVFVAWHVKKITPTVRDYYNFLSQLVGISNNPAHADHHNFDSFPVWCTLKLRTKYYNIIMLQCLACFHAVDWHTCYFYRFFFAHLNGFVKICMQIYFNFLHRAWLLVCAVISLFAQPADFSVNSSYQKIIA